MLIRKLEKASDLKMVADFYTDAPDYWEIAEGCPPGIEKANEFFDEVPPNSDPSRVFRFGLFLGERLSGIADLSFGFPVVGDAYIGLMILGPWARNQGIGKCFLSHLEGLAKVRRANNIYVGVMAINPKGRAFWEREGFSDTGLSGMCDFGDNRLKLHRLVKTL